MTSGSLLASAEVAMEYAALKNYGHCPKGVYVLPSSESILLWDAVLFVHQGYYADSVLKFRVRFPTDYPSKPPLVTFSNDVFHPLVSQKDGTLNISVRFPYWRAKQDHVFHLLHWIKVVFKKQTLDNLRETDCLNTEAYRLYHESTQSFASLASQSAMLSQSSPALFENSNSTATLSSSAKRRDTKQGIVFSEAGEQELNDLRSRLGLQSWLSTSGALNP